MTDAEEWWDGLSPRQKNEVWCQMGKALAAPASSSFWRKMESAPKDGTEIIILFDSATVDIVRLCWWNDGIGCDFKPDPQARGWWSYIHSVTQELIDIDLMHPLGWMPHPDRPNEQGHEPAPREETTDGN